MTIPYRFDPVVHATYLHATVYGAHTPENASRFLREVYEACIANQKDSVLLDMRLEGPTMGTSSIFSVVQERSGAGRELRRIAYIDATREPEKAVFAETVARNRGVNVRFFRSVEDAKKWLEG
jgi:hypothetical protein